MALNKTSISCKNCTRYDDGWCYKHEVTCSSAGNAKLCSYFVNKHGEDIKPIRRKRCNKCEHFIYASVGNKSRARYTYYCIEISKPVNYNALSLCAKYKKKG